MTTPLDHTTRHETQAGEAPSGPPSRSHPLPPPPPPGATRAAAGHGPGAHGPPTPPTASRLARVPLAAWVAGLGALLLLAAAATFLAVRWDAMGPTARVAVVGAVTAAAIIGGDRLRRSLPVVGSVVFHLGALLLPVDALGLTIQLGAPGWVRWVAVGLTAVVALPVLAVIGRAPVLGVAALLGVPVVATGLGLVTTVPPAILVAVVGVLVVAAAARSGPPALRPALEWGALALPAAAVVIGLTLDLLAALPVSGVAETASAAGWSAGWQVRAVVAAVVVPTLLVRARRGDRLAVVVAVVTSLLAVVHLVLPPATPRAVQLWTPALLWFAAEVALLVQRHGGGDRPRPGVLRVVVVVGEVLAVPVAAAVVALTAGAVVAADPVLGGLLGIVSAAWGVAALRVHRGSGGPGTSEARAAALLAVVAAWHAATVPLVMGWPRSVAVGVALLAAAARMIPAALGRRSTVDTATSTVDLAAAGALLLVAAGLAAGGPESLLVAGLAPLIVLPLLHLVARRGAALASVVASAGLVVGVALLASEGFDALLVSRGAVGLLVGVTSLGVVVATSGVPRVADGARLVTAVTGLLTVLPVAWLPAGEVGSDPVVLDLLGSGAVVPAALLGLGLLVDAVRSRRPVAAAAAAAVLVRVATATALVAGLDVAVVGAVLLATAIALTVSVSVLGRGMRPSLLSAAVTTAVLSGPAGWVLLGEERVLRSAAVLVAGAAAVLLGLALRRPAASHLGAAIATVGAWSLLAEIGSTALDLWVAPVAVQLLLAGAAARRSADTSSWIAYAPAILLVGIPALLERLAGGPGWHGLLAGGVAVGAVALGGRFGLKGPLVSGAVLLVAVVVVETLTVIVGLPTWVWLSLGGVTLLGAAAGIERLGQSPREAAQRIVAGLQDGAADPPR